MLRKVAITVDTEALPNRAANNHVARLIYGDYQGKHYGIPLMMDIAERYNAGLTFFLDYPEYYLYGENIIDAGKYIARRGHDVQPHLHLESFSEEFWAAEALPAITFDTNLKIWGFQELCNSPAHVRYALRATMELHARVSPETPSGFRTIGYTITPLLVELLGEIGMLISSNYNAAYAVRAPSLSGPQKPFRWHTGMVELPVSCLQCRNRMVPYNFDVKSLLNGAPEECAEHHKKYLDSFFSLYGDNSIAVMVLHSRSFFRMDEDGRFNILDEAAPEKFEAILRTLSPTVEFVTIKDIARNLDTLLPDLPVRPADHPPISDTL